MYTDTGNERRSVRELGARCARHRIRNVERESFTIDFVHEFIEYVYYAIDFRFVASSEDSAAVAAG